MLYHPRKIQHGFQKTQPNNCSKSHRSSNDKKRSPTCTHNKCKKLNIETRKDKDRYFVFLLVQTSLVGISCLREENHFGSYFFVHKMGIILTSSKCCQNKYIEDFIEFNAFNSELVETNRYFCCVTSLQVRYNHSFSYVLTDHSSLKTLTFCQEESHISEHLKAFSTVFSSSSFFSAGRPSLFLASVQFHSHTESSIAHLY